MASLAAPDRNVSEDLRDAVGRGRFDEANEIVIRFWAELLTEHGSLLRTLFSVASISDLLPYPLLLMMLGFAHHEKHATRPMASRYLALGSQAARSLRGQASLAERILIHTGESVALRLLGQPKVAVRSARAAVQLLNTAVDDEIHRIGHAPRLYAHLGWTFYEGGRTEEALVAFLRGAAGVGEENSDGRASLAMLCVMQALEGDMHAADQNVGLASAPSWDAREEAVASGRQLRLAEALIDLERGEPVRAAAHLAAMRYERTTVEGWIEIARAEALTELILGRAGNGLSAVDAFARARGPEGRSASTLQRLAPVRALLELALGDVEAADLLLRDVAAPTPQLLIDRARVDLCRGRVYAALHAVKRLASDELTPRAAAEATAIEAAVILRLPGGQRSTGAVDRLGALLQTTGLRLPLALLPRSDHGRVAAALDRRGHRDLRTDIGALLPDFSRLALTPREVALLKALAAPGSSRISAAAQLHISVNTVKTQLRLLYRKLGVADREGALAAAFAGGALQEEDEPSFQSDCASKAG